MSQAPGPTAGDGSRDASGPAGRAGAGRRLSLRPGSGAVTLRIGRSSRSCQRTPKGGPSTISVRPLAGCFLHAVVPDGDLEDIYFGMTQFMVIQLIGLALIFGFPQIALWLSAYNYGS